MKEKIRIACGAGFSGDRLEPALILAERGELDYLVLECLAERTIALAQKRKLQDASKGYDPLLERRMESLLPHLIKNNICLISNMGAANPIEAAKKVVSIARRQNLKIKVAAVFGDDVFEKINPTMLTMEQGEPLGNFKDIISANAYLGVESILPALNASANVIITGRVADPSLFLAPMIHEFGWHTDNYDLLGKGTVVGHLMECAGQISGGYFADPFKKPVAGLDVLGYPFADVYRDGSAVIGKVAGTGGIINLLTAKEQLLYEVTNPHEYFTPDVVADFMSVKLEEIGKDLIKVKGGSGKTKPSTYKVSVGYKAFYLGEGEISYAGASALERAELAGDIIKKRLNDKFKELRIDLVGNSAIHRGNFGNTSIPYEVRLRVAGKASTQAQAALIGEEVEALYTNGPAGGGGARKYIHEIVGIVSVLLDRAEIQTNFQIFES